MTKSEGWLPAALPAGWMRIGARSLFTERRVVATNDEVHLTPSQTHGVLPQAEYTAVTGNRVVAVIEGGDNMKLVLPNDFVVHLRSFQGGIEWSSHRGKVSPAYTVLTPTARVEPRFFRWALKSSGYIQELRSTTNQMRDGQTLKFKHIAMIEYALPSQAEQRAIADYLDRETAQIDALIAKQEQLIATLRERRQATIDSAFPATGRSVKLRRLLVERPTYGVLVPNYDSAGDVPFIRVGDLHALTELDPERRISASQSREYSRTILEGGEVLVGVVGRMGIATIAPVRLAGANVNRAVAVLRGRSPAINRFIAAWIGSTSYRLQAELATSGDSVQATLGMGDLAGFSVPDVADQHRIVAELDAQTARIDELIGKTERFVALAKERRAALITAAVTGQIGVPGFEGFETPPSSAPQPAEVGEPAVEGAAGESTKVA